MKRSIAMLMAFSILAALAGCTAETEPVKTPVITVTPAPAPTPTPIPDPVTPTDIPAYFAPGLNTVGVQPVEKHRIGIVVGPSFDTARYNTLNGLCDQYTYSFGLEFTLTPAAGEAEQLGAAQALAGSNIDFLILSADGDLSAIGSLCEQSDIPYITMDCRAGTPGQGSYVCSIERDDYLIGILTGLSIADKLTEKYGEARGNIGEITGAVGDEANILRSAGLRRALFAYPDIQVVCSVTTEGDTAYHAAVNMMKAYRAGELDGIVAPDDTAATETMQAAVNYDRDELLGFIWSAGGTKDGLTGVWYGQFAQTVEVTSQSGTMALEYALQYLEGSGSNIPPVVCSMTRGFTSGSQERKDAIAQIIADIDAQGIAYCMDNEGNHALFEPDERLVQIYPKHYYEYDDVASYLAEFEPYATQKAVYAAGNSG